MGYDEQTGIYTIKIRCQSCRYLLKTYRSYEDIFIDINTDTNRGDYPVELCPWCFDFWKDSTKNSRDNPRTHNKEFD